MRGQTRGSAPRTGRTCARGPRSSPPPRGPPPPARRRAVPRARCPAAPRTWRSAPRPSPLGGTPRTSQRPPAPGPSPRSAPPG